MDIFSVVREFGIFPSGVILGLMLGAVYDIIRILRTVIPHKAFVVFAGDLLYTLFFWLAMFSFGVGTIGKIRYYIVIALALGFAAERFTLGNYAVKFFSGTMEIIAKQSRKIRGFFVRNT